MRVARVTASVLLWAPSLVRMAVTWNLTVCSLIWSLAAIALLGSPSATRASTSISRSLSPARSWRGPVRRVGLRRRVQTGLNGEQAAGRGSEGGGQHGRVGVTHEDPPRPGQPDLASMGGVGDQRDYGWSRVLGVGQLFKR